MSDREQIDLAAGAVARGRGIRRRRRAALVATGAVLTALAAVPFVRADPVGRTDPTGRPEQPRWVRPTTTTPAPPPAAVFRSAGPAEWWRAPVRLPGGRIVTGVTRTDVGNGRVTIDALDRGNVALDTGSGRYTVVPGNYRDISVSPTGRYAVLTSDHRAHQIGVLAVGSTTVRWTTIRHFLRPQWSADGRRLLLTEEGGFAILDVATGRLRRHPVDQATYECTDYCEFTWWPGDREVAVALTDPVAPRSESAPHVRRGVGVFSAATGRPVRVVPVKATPIGQDCWSADGRFVLVMPATFTDRSVHVVEVATGRIVGTVPVSARVSRADMSPHMVGAARILAVTDGSAVLYDLTGRPLEQQPLPGNLGLRELSFGPAP